MSSGERQGSVGVTIVVTVVRGTTYDLCVGRIVQDFVKEPARMNVQLSLDVVRCCLDIVLSPDLIAGDVGPHCPIGAVER